MKNNNKKTVVICLDSFKKDYLVHTPFLESLTNKYAHGQLKTIMGYTGIGAAVACGKYPKDTGIWREFVFSDNPSYPWITRFSFLEHTLFEKYIRLFINISVSLYRYISDKGYYFSIRDITRYG